MAYIRPELLLIGAAQNLVLETSDQKNVGPCLDVETVIPETYSTLENW